MESAYGISSLGIQTNAVKFYYSKRKESVSKDLRRSAVGRQLLGSSPPPPPPRASDALEIGAFYEIDHGNLPPKSPIHLKAVRVVKVGETTKLDVTVCFPSTYSLRNYFSLITANPSADKFPELDERFVMSTNQAKKIIKRLVSTKKLSEEKHLQSFWLVAPFVLPCSTAAAAPSTAAEQEEEEEQEEAEEAKLDALQLALKYSVNLQWGIRRKVKYIGRQLRDQLPSSPVKMEEDNKGEMMEVQNIICTRKRACEATRKKSKKRKEEKKKKKKKREKKKARYEKSKDHSTGRGLKERWSTERYESAELKLLNIMREKGAVPGNSILRQELREEARKHIGDTGLLDHLLKHMAGKVVSDGRERFRRRHNSEGAMEYWLEPAELEEVRKKAGVTDPYWVPPSGWKPGDAMSACVPCGTQCQKEFSLLREEISILKSDMEGLLSLKLLEKEAEVERQFEAARCSILQEKYEMMLKMNTKLEEELERLTLMLKGMKEEMELLKQEKEKKKEVAEEVDQMKIEEGKAGSGPSSNGNGGNDGNTVIEKKSSTVGETGKKKGVVRRSGFRICKPQGTFLWPNMATTGAVIRGGETGIISSNNNSINNISSCSSAAAVYSMMSNTTTTTSMITGINSGIGVVIPTTNALADYSEYQQKQLAMVFGNNGGDNYWGAAAGACINGIPTPPSCSSATSTPKMLLLPSPTTPKSSTATSPSQFKAVTVNNHTSSLASSVGDHQVKKREDATVHVRAAAWRSTITTDLVLATPSHSSIN